MKRLHVMLAAALALPIAACQTQGQEGMEGGSAGMDAGSGSTGSSTGSTGSGTGSGGSGTGGTSGSGGSGIPSLVNVNLENVLNDLSVRLNVDRANIPVNAQIPINVAANVCGVSVNVLSVSTGGQASCTAKNASAELAQVVQQQVAAGGSVGGGAQGGSTATTGGSSGQGGTGTSGATGTTTTSTGASETNTQQPPDDPN